MIAELLETDVIVIGAPMYNFSIPTRLKSWIDFVSVPVATRFEAHDYVLERRRPSRCAFTVCHRRWPQELPPRQHVKAIEPSIRRKQEEEAMGKGILLWLLGIPLPIILILLLVWH
jgi:hypothetical protein